MSVHLKKSIPPMGLERLLCAFYARNLPDFLRFALPNEWGGVKRAILESGAWMTTRKVKWAPRWSGIHMTLKTGDSEDIVAVKSVLYRAHDCLHQLWGLPLPGQNDDDFYEYKRSQMCGEVAVLYLVEFVLAQYYWDHIPEVRPYLEKRCAMHMNRTVFKGKRPEEIAARLDGILHRHHRPRWVRNDPKCSAFADYYVPMFEEDRGTCDHNWALLQEDVRACRSVSLNAPITRYDRKLDGLELTQWMVRDFHHLLRSGSTVDTRVQEMNRKRRSQIVLPEDWR